MKYLVLVVLFVVSNTSNAAVFQCNNVDCTLLTSNINATVSVVFLLVGIVSTIYLILTDK